MAASDDLKKAEKALRDGVRSYAFGGRTYTLTELRDDLIPRLEALTEKEGKKAREQKIKEEKSAQAKSVATAQAAFNAAEKQYRFVVEKFTNRTATQQVVDEARLRRDTAAENLARAKGAVPKTVTARPSTTTKTDTTAKPADGSAEQAEGARLAGLEPSAPPPPPPPVDAKPPTTKPGEPPKPAINILDELADRFPAYRDWTVEQATGYFGADLIQVLNDVAAGKYGVGKEKDRDSIERAIRGTDYWNRTESSIRTWDSLDVPQRNKQVQQQKGLLAQSFGELGLDDATLTELATTIQRTGLNDLGARQLVFGAAFTKPRTETGVQPRQLALESSVADEIRKIGKAYGYAPGDLDAQIESILTGKPYGPTGVVLTKDAFRQKAEKLARGSFGHLKDQFDSGLSLEDIFGNYRELASRVLEVDPNSIDFVKDPDKWLSAFGDAKTGQLSLSDWVAKLKSDDKYGYQFTNQARQQATNLVMEMEKAFGFRR